MSEQEQLEEWNALPISEKMRYEIAMASAYADEVAALEGEAGVVTLPDGLRVGMAYVLNLQARCERLERALMLIRDQADGIEIRDEAYSIADNALAVEEEYEANTAS
jgi:hypothetical protein